MHLLLNWLVTTAAILIAGYLLPGVEIRNFFTAVITALVLGLINAIIRPLLIILTLPLTVVTLGLFHVSHLSRVFDRGPMRGAGQGSASGHPLSS